MPTRRSAPRAQPPVRPAAPPPVEIPAHLLQRGIKIKEDLTKAFTAWERTFRDVVKSALTNGPQAPRDGVTEYVVGGVRVSLAKTWPKPSTNIDLMRTDLAAAVRNRQISASEICTLLDTGAIAVANGTAVANLLQRTGRNPESYVVQPENPDVPTRVDLKWEAVQGAQIPDSPLSGLQDQVVQAAQPEPAAPAAPRGMQVR